MVISSHLLKGTFRKGVQQEKVTLLVPHLIRDEIPIEAAIDCFGLQRWELRVCIKPPPKCDRPHIWAFGSNQETF
jgi:hypothetical protein